MLLSFLSNGKAIITPLTSVHFTVSEAEGITAFVSGTRYHPVDTNSIAAHGVDNLPQVFGKIAEKTRVSGFAKA